MKLVYTEQAIASLEEALEFMINKVSYEKLLEIRGRILDKTETLSVQPFQGQKEPFLVHLGLGHRRLVEGHYKIIYRIIGDFIYVTDIFDSRQDPYKMQG